MMRTYRIWEGERTFLPGEDTSKFTVTEIFAEDLGMYEDVDFGGMSGRTFYFYKTPEGELVLNVVQWTDEFGSPRYCSVYRYRNAEEAKRGEFGEMLVRLRYI